MTGPLSNPAFQPNHFLVLRIPSLLLPSDSFSSISNFSRQLDSFLLYNRQTINLTSHRHPAYSLISSFLAAIRKIRTPIDCPCKLWKSPRCACPILKSFQHPGCLFPNKTNRPVPIPHKWHNSGDFHCGSHYVEFVSHCPLIWLWRFLGFGLSRTTYPKFYHLKNETWMTFAHI